MLQLLLQKLALAHMRACSFYFHPARPIQISYEYKTKTLFSIAFQQLVTTLLQSLRKEDIDIMGNGMYIAFLWWNHMSLTL
jgi:hypothetical protein